MEGERGRGPEGPESTYENEESLYRELHAADDEVDRLMRELDEVIARSDDRAEAERQALQTLIPSIEAARARARSALERWLDAIKNL